MEPAKQHRISEEDQDRRARITDALDAACVSLRDAERFAWAGATTQVEWPALAECIAGLRQTVRHLAFTMPGELAPLVGSVGPGPEDPHAQLDWNLTNLAPQSDDVIRRFEEIRRDARLLGHNILELAPPCRERSLALTQLEQTVMWAAAAIARNQGPDS